MIKLPPSTKLKLTKNSPEDITMNAFSMMRKTILIYAPSRSTNRITATEMHLVITFLFWKNLPAICSSVNWSACGEGEKEKNTFLWLIHTEFLLELKLPQSWC